MRKLRKLFLLISSAPFLVAASDPESGEIASSVPEPFLEITEEGLTLVAHDIPLDQILARIAEAYRTPLALEGELATPVTVSFRDLSLKEAIRRLVGDAAFMILHEPSSSNGVPTLPSKIWIYAPASGKSNLLADTELSNTNGQHGSMVSAHDEPTTSERPDPRDAAQEEIETMAERGAPGDLDVLGKVVAEHADAAMRYLAVTLLGDIHEPRAVLAIEQGLGDEDPKFRRYVVETLGHNESLDAVRSLGYTIYGERDPEIRRLAIHMLKSRDEEPARAFLKDAARDPDSSVRRSVER